MWEDRTGTPASFPSEPILRESHVHPGHFQGMEKTPASLYSAFSLFQGGHTVLDVSYNVNDGSEEKLYITEAEARCASWGFLPVPQSPGCPT